MMLPEEPPRLISPLSPTFAYFLGTGMLLIALNCFLRPRQEYRRFGLPLEDSRTPAKKKTHSPLIYLKGSRELTYGLALIILQYQGNVAGVTAFAGIISLAGLADGLVTKTLGHFFAFVVLASWAAWRVHQVREDSKGGWPDDQVHILGR
ncbi:hypothetical protein KVR01_008889 [Diaporthe batatas]|uniref:uncharacterized protein n=1 Tax=Diaporthe batatas TaxID=748121 RepID=UPI001D04F5F5|nr:uncharacterized protein KVR01_008889 [Diaporthe batatas]KAG8160625.1 hypothetical protein KVR01_008889 [Diaporthe batatas]